MATINEINEITINLNQSETELASWKRPPKKLNQSKDKR